MARSSCARLRITNDVVCMGCTGRMSALVGESDETSNGSGEVEMGVRFGAKGKGVRMRSFLSVPEHASVFNLREGVAWAGVHRRRVNGPESASHQEKVARDTASQRRVVRGTVPPLSVPVNIRMRPTEI